uniref:Nucleolar protein 11 N-terminal domain-containing protein n=1 Tax=Lygus hesperus TaxID=30085 RepID=A0A0K8T6C8_LYGHE
MAKILAPYALCPLAERKRFVGVSPDSESGCVIVTLARNIIIRYRLSNQKQVSSWSTKAMLSAPVIYDHASKLYYGIFNSDEVSSWEEHVVSLGKLSKTKFIWLIHSIVSSDDIPAVLVYQNGVISPLKTDLANSKAPPEVKDDQLLPPEENIKEARLVSLASVHYVALYTATEAGETILHLVPVDQDRGTRSFIKLNRDGFKLTAFTILDGDSPVLITLWSDGKLFSPSLPIKDLFPGKLISMVSCLDVNHPAVILQLGQEHFVLYGAAPNSEGAYLVILGRQFGLPESRAKMKVYDNECRMWTCRNNIVMVLGGHLVVAPFRLNTVKLASLIGVIRRH